MRRVVILPSADRLADDGSFLVKTRGGRPRREPHRLGILAVLEPSSSRSQDVPTAEPGWPVGSRITTGI
jgi:hypothetical protein